MCMYRKIYANNLCIKLLEKKLYIKVMCIIKVIIRVYLIEGVKSFAYKLYKLCLQAIIFQKWKGVGNFFF